MFENSYDPTKSIVKIRDYIVFFSQVESIKLNKNNVEINYISGRKEIIEINPEEVINSIFGNA